MEPSLEKEFLNCRSCTFGYLISDLTLNTGISRHFHFFHTWRTRLQTQPWLHPSSCSLTVALSAAVCAPVPPPVRSPPPWRLQARPIRDDGPVTARRQPLIPLPFRDPSRPDSAFLYFILPPKGQRPTHGDKWSSGGIIHQRLRNHSWPLGSGAGRLACGPVRNATTGGPQTDSEATGLGHYRASSPGHELPHTNTYRWTHCPATGQTVSLTYNDQRPRWYTLIVKYNSFSHTPFISFPVRQTFFFFLIEAEHKLNNFNLIRYNACPV